MSTTETFALIAAMQSGTAVTPEDQSWDEARQAWNLAVDQHPAAIAMAESSKDVVAVLNACSSARSEGRGAGHRARSGTDGLPHGHDPPQDRTNERCSATVVTPEDPYWDEVRQAWYRVVDQYPTAVAMAESAKNVVAVVNTARQQGLRVVAQGTGHAAAPMGPLADTILVKMTGMRGVQVDPDARSPASRRGRSGSTSSRQQPSMDWRRSPDPLPMWAWSATRWAAA